MASFESIWKSSLIFTYCNIHVAALSIRNRIKVIAIPVDQAQRLLRRLSIAEACDIPSNNPTTLDVYDCWLSVKQSHADWTELVEAFLMERGLGYFVSGVQPIGMLLILKLLLRK